MPPATPARKSRSNWSAATSTSTCAASACLNLKHPHLLDLYDIRQDDKAHLGGDGIRGRPELGKRAGRPPHGLPPQEALGWIDGIGAGVGYLHDAASSTAI